VTREFLKVQVKEKGCSISGIFIQNRVLFGVFQGILLPKPANAPSRLLQDLFKLVYKLLLGWR
jgi:hypothetical protein